MLNNNGSGPFSTIPASDGSYHPLTYVLLLSHGIYGWNHGLLFKTLPVEVVKIQGCLRSYFTLSNVFNIQVQFTKFFEAVFCSNSTLLGNNERKILKDLNIFIITRCLIEQLITHFCGLKFQSRGRERVGCRSSLAKTMLIFTSHLLAEICTCTKTCMTLLQFQTNTNSPKYSL